MKSHHLRVAELLVGLMFSTGSQAQATRGVDGVCRPSPCPGTSAPSRAPSDDRYSRAADAIQGLANIYADDARRKREERALEEEQEAIEEARRKRQEQAREIEHQQRLAELRERQAEQEALLARQNAVLAQQFDAMDEFPVGNGGSSAPSEDPFASNPWGGGQQGASRPPSFQAKDPKANWAGHGCSFFTRPAIEAEGMRLNQYADGKVVVYGDWTYRCEEQRWVVLEPSKFSSPETLKNNDARVIEGT